MKKVLITGGAGFIGSHLVDRLIDEGYQSVVVDNLSNGRLANVNKKADFHKLDIREPKFDLLVTRVRPHCIFHLAAQSSISSALSNSIEHIEINLIGTQKILDVAKNSQVRKIIFASSAAVYSDIDKLPTEEDSPKEPISFYGVTKLCSEYLLQGYHRRFGLPYVSFRIANVYGGRQDSIGEGGVVAIFIQKILDKKEVVIYGDGNQTRDFIDVSDVVSAHISALEKNVIGEFNISTGKETSVNELYKKLLKISRATDNRKYKSLLHKEVKNSSLSPEKFKQSTGWKSKIDLNTGLERTLKHFKSNQ